MIGWLVVVEKVIAFLCSAGGTGKLPSMYVDRRMRFSFLSLRWMSV